jgi:hypothetical protein
MRQSSGSTWFEMRKEFKSFEIYIYFTSRKQGNEYGQNILWFHFFFKF